MRNSMPTHQYLLNIILYQCSIQCTTINNTQLPLVLYHLWAQKYVRLIGIILQVRSRMNGTADTSHNVGAVCRSSWMCSKQTSAGRL